MLEYYWNKWFSSGRDLKSVNYWNLRFSEDYSDDLFKEDLKKAFEAGYEAGYEESLTPKR